MAMPVTICTMPSAIEPIRIIVRSSSGSKSFGSAKTVPGLTMATSCVKSPKKSACQRAHDERADAAEAEQAEQLAARALGPVFLLMMTEAIIMSKP